MAGTIRCGLCEPASLVCPDQVTCCRAMKGRNKSEPRFSSLADVLQGVLRRLDPKGQASVYRLWIDWEDIVGRKVAQRARPRDYRNGMLLVVAASSSWRQELEFLKPELLRKIRNHLGDDSVRDLTIFVGELGETAQPPQRPAPRDPARDVLLEAWDYEPILATVCDPELARSLRRLCQARERRRQAAQKRGTPANGKT
ncbi:MAG: hypothetical protein KatS3mg077_1085 [Candidatus Binatia bacterium]|nr:MAG: hypothetical protein KatS3mg077_1085 [Candidatus Binatia bacterium]